MLRDKKVMARLTQYFLDNPRATVTAACKATGSTRYQAAKVLSQRATPIEQYIAKQMSRADEQVADYLAGKAAAEGRKDDTGKLPWHLLPPDAISEILKVLEFGAGKYGARNWEQGMAWSRPFSALMRHMWSWQQGEEIDEESGLPHLAHAGCCLLFLLSYDLRNMGFDDRND